MLPESVPANLAFADLVVKDSDNGAHRRFFFNTYSVPVLRSIALTVYSDVPVEEAVRSITSQYYEFVSMPVIGGKAQWRQLTSYKGLNGMKLLSWLKLNAMRWFVKEKAKEERIAKNETGMLDFVDYASLISVEDHGIGLSDKEQARHDRIARAWDALSDKDKDVLHFMVIEKLYWKDAYEELSRYITPREGRQVMETWSDKRRQDALAMMKARAIEHLTARYNKQK